MKIRRMAGALVGAAVCGMLAVCLCPGTALARYAPDTLTAADMAKATTVKLNTDYAFSIKDPKPGVANNAQSATTGLEYCADPSIASFYKFTPAKTTSYTIYDSGDKADTYLAIYEPKSGKYEFMDVSDDSSSAWNNGFGDNFDLTAGKTYYLAASAYYPNQEVAGKLRIAETKTPVSASARILAGCETFGASLDITLSYADGTKCALDTVGVYGSSPVDPYGNKVSTELTDSSADGSNYSDGVAGNYKVNINVADSNNSPLFTTVVTVPVVSDATMMAKATAIAKCGAPLDAGFYKVTIANTGYYTTGNGYSYLYEKDSSGKLDSVTSSFNIDGWNGYLCYLHKNSTYYVKIYTHNGQKATFDCYTSNPEAAKGIQTIKVTTAKKTYKAKKLKKKAYSFKIGATASAGGKLTYKVTSGKKYVKVSKSGKVTVKKGAKKGTYKIKVTAAGTNWYKAATTTVKVKVK